jgi:hypothetical protein
LFPFEVKPLDTRFKYLGFYIKPNCYTRVDWLWLEKQFEKRIMSWNHKWLTLGGRFILVKSVLESISVYWMSLAKIPKCVLNNIRRIIFSFLWSGKKEKECMHLTRWKKIGKPKKDGGWGIKNIYIFGQALSVKSLWICLMLPCIWHEIILRKYLKRKTIEKWFRQGRKKWNGTSNFWRALTSSVRIITDWFV